MQRKAKFELQKMPVLAQCYTANLGEYCSFHLSTFVISIEALFKVECKRSF